MIDAATRSLVHQRADDRCEYWRIHRLHSHLTHHVEHIVAKQHGGSDSIENLALACHRCNLCKGPNLTGLDPESQDVVLLFHPRRNRWAEHFAFRRARIEGLTPSGRATVHVFGDE